jgi:hypothetical protein
MYLHHVTAMLSLVPDGGRLNLHTESLWLETEWDKMKGHAEAEFSGDLTWESMADPWKRVTEQLRTGQEGKGLEIRLVQEGITSYKGIMAEYMAEQIQKAEEYHPDSTPDRPPWI